MAEHQHVGVLVQADGLHLVRLLVVVVWGEVRHILKLEGPDAVSLLGHGQPVCLHVCFRDVENVIPSAQVLRTTFFNGEHRVALLGHLAREVRAGTGRADDDDIV